MHVKVLCLNLCLQGKEENILDQAKIRLCRELAKTFIGVNRIEIYMYQFNVGSGNFTRNYRMWSLVNYRGQNLFVRWICRFTMNLNFFRLTHWVAALSTWWVKLSGIRQSKILKYCRVHQGALTFKGLTAHTGE